MTLLLAILLAAADPRQVPDPLYAPKAGDRCYVGSFDARVKKCESAVACVDEPTYLVAWRNADDADLFERLSDLGKLADLEPGTLVEILKLQNYPERVGVPDAAMVRALEGIQRDRILWIDRSDLL